MFEIDLEKLPEWEQMKKEFLKKQKQLSASNGSALSQSDAKSGASSPTAATVPYKPAAPTRNGFAKLAPFISMSIPNSKWSRGTQTSSSQV